MAHHDAVGLHQHAHRLADQAPRHAVAVRIHLDTGFAAHHPLQFSRQGKGRLAGKRLQGCALVALKAQPRRLCRRPMAAHVGHLSLPAHKVGRQGLPTGEDVAGQRVLLHIAHAVLVLALGLGPEGRAGLGRETPMPGKGQQAFVERHFTRLHVMRENQRPGVIQQHLARDAAEVGKGAFQARQPGRLSLVAKGRHISEPRIAQCRHEHMHLLPGPIDLYRGRAKINLQLLPRRRLEAYRRPRLRRPFRPVAPAGPFHRAQAHQDALLPLQFLAHHVAVAAVLCKLRL